MRNLYRTFGKEKEKIAIRKDINYEKSKDVIEDGWMDIIEKDVREG